MVLGDIWSKKSRSQNPGMTPTHRGGCSFVRRAKKAVVTARNLPQKSLRIPPVKEAKKGKRKVSRRHISRTPNPQSTSSSIFQFPGSSLALSIPSGWNIPPHPHPHRRSIHRVCYLKFPPFRPFPTILVSVLKITPTHLVCRKEQPSRL